MIFDTLPDKKEVPIHTIHGVRSVNTTLIDSARVLGATQSQIFRKVLIPAA